METRMPPIAGVLAVALLALTACNDHEAELEAIQSLDGLNVIDENNLNEIMLDYGDPNQAVAYFQKSMAAEPDRVDFKQGYARALMRANRIPESIGVYGELESSGQITDKDRLYYADALIQNGDWKKARDQLNKIPPTVETYDRYRLEAMIADFQKQWKKSDAYYEQARAKTTRPAKIYNNWGISKSARGEKQAAEDMFVKAISFDSSLFSAKNNLSISRATRKVYDLPMVPMSKAEEAQLLHNVALQAIRNGDVEIGRGLLEKAIETHPQHFPEAVAKLEALESNVLR
jgi:hypothetical protein